MAAADVTVQRLRLRAQRAVPGLLPRVEDALRLSSKPAALLNRLVLVRRLRLRAAAGASAQTLALQLERAWQQLAARAQPMEDAGDTAEAVWAPSLAAARQLLLRRWLRGEATEAWFWQRLLPPGVAGPWPQRAVALMLATDDEASEPTVFAAAARTQASQVGALLALIAAHRMTAAFVQAISEAQAFAVLGLIEAPRQAPAWPHRRLQPRSPALRAETPRAQLFAVMAAMSSAPEEMLIEHRAAHPAALAQEPADMQARPSSLDGPVSTAQRVQAAIAASRATAQSPVASVTDMRLDHGLASPWSGLWLLLPILLRQGVDDADDPLAAWAGAMRAACRRLRVPDDDPLRTALAGLDLPPADDAHWLRSARLAAVHDARLPLLRIARRRGAAWVSSERIDIEFPAASLDLRVRRAGFDINPGFVPWLGRIVHFHYPS